MIDLVCANCGKTFQSVRRAKKFCSCQCANKFNSKDRGKEIEQKDAKIVWSCGGGIDSTAIAVLIYQGKLPKPDYGFMADCGFESEQTIYYVKKVIMPKMKEVGVDFHLVPSEKYSKVELFDESGHCSIPAFRKNPDGSVSKFSTHCNGNWKQKVMRRWLREMGVDRAIDWVGIAADEVTRAYKQTGVRWLTNEYPLVRLGLSRENCIDIIRSSGWPIPIRSSCVICPLRQQFEWLRLYIESPADFERACRIEEEMHVDHPDVFLLSSCKPLRSILTECR